MDLKTQRITGNSEKSLPRIAMIGCGAIAECYHLPGLAQVPGILSNVVLVDRNIERARSMSAMFGIARHVSDVSDILNEIDGAIVAVPPALHYPICMQLLTRGVPVLCEKPLAESPAEAREMVEAARKHHVALAVNHTRRLLPAYAQIKRLLDSQAVGGIREICWQEGCEFSWPAATAFQFRSGAKGVLLDTGIHSLDLICWWLGQKPKLVSCQTDSFGGPEALAEIRLQAGACDVYVKLSWLSRLANRYSIVAERGTITGELDYYDRLTITALSGQRKLQHLRAAEKTYNDFGCRIIANFIDTIAGRAEPLISAESVLPALDVMDECYEVATRLEMPWVELEEGVCHATA